MVIRGLTTLLVFIFLAVGASTAQEQAIRADDLVDSIGVNSHFAYTNTYYYQKYPQAISAISAAGIRHIRDGYHYWPAGNQMYKIHQAVHAAGIGTDYVVAYNSLTTVSDLESFQSLVGDMESIEGPNEIDLNGGSNWETLLASFLPTLGQAGAALHVPVLGPSLFQEKSYGQLGDISQYINYTNLHIYFGGRNPGTNGWGSVNAEGHSYGSIPWWLDNANISASGVASYVTESGYNQLPTTTTPYTVPNSVASFYTIQTIFEMMTHGIKRTYMYELMDEPSSPELGLMTNTLQPKSSYTALQSLTSVLVDKGASFAPGKLQYSLSGSTANVHHLLMQKQDGTFYLALWLNLPIYNPATNESMSVTPQKVTVTLDAGHAVHGNFSIDSAGMLTNTKVNNSYAYDVQLTPSVILLKIVPTN
ncbi:hypothetical protein H7849_25185 [Alloacidobacterium dinghuense]|uniref:Uncharacterized protein n=1 Tax=Alloacidobacterium dinghuense TaxID=2763107 RepID=A0A7G8BI71_9BACT|nr:hypothetical protein [Alloacidobacterium dinghuense]QNI32241.1 hypothetical protein H7849_25185 [Alloacidobacterium dinghuense]